MTEGSTVIVQAGYQNDGVPQIIWAGPVFQAIWERVDVVDFKLTLHCILNRTLTTQNFVKVTLPKLTKAADQARIIAQRSVTPIQVDSSHLQLLTSPPLVRAETIYGNPHRFLGELARQNNLASWFTAHQFAMASLNGGGGKPIATYAPATVLGTPPVKQTDGTTLSLIGTPQQTQYGINFKVLLDSRLQISSPLPEVAIQMQFIRQAAVQYPLPPGQFPPRPLQNQYTVVAVRHYGDTRGNSWYSEVTAFSQVQDVIALLGNG
jgi:hypothetical protein